MYSIRCVLIFFVTLAILYPAFSQDRKLAEEYMATAEEMRAGSNALDDIKDVIVFAVNADTTYIKANYEAGHLYILTRNREMAASYFERVLRMDPDYRFDLEYWIGLSYQYGLQFDKAISWFKRYKEKVAKKPNYQGKDRTSPAVVDHHIFECENGKKFAANPGNFSIVNVGREVNSEFDDYGPVLNESGTELVFTTRRREDNMNENVADDNKPWEDIFYSTKSGDKWEFAKNIGTPVNTETHDSNLALSADGKLLFIYKDDNGGDIYYCTRNGNGTWGEPIALPGIINSSYEEKSITISRDEKTIIFMSNRPGGLGGTDLYKATKDSKGEWTYVKNLGPKINTEFDEDGPFIDYDGKTLYFSSKGHEGMGGFDIFKSTFDEAKNEWSDPINLGYPINTPDDDIYFISTEDGKTFYYSSVREDGLGYQDIYKIIVPDGFKDPNVASTEPVTVPKKDTTNTVANIEPVKDPVKEPVKEPVKTEPKKEAVPLRYIVNVVDANGNAPLNAKVTLVGAKDNVIVKGTSSPGTYQFMITGKTAKDYKLTVDMDGYIFQTQIVRIDAAGTAEKIVNNTIQLKKISVGVTSILRNLYFDFNKATFKTESYGELNKLEAMLRQNANVKVEIGGHTDGVGPVAYNLLLSRKRAEAVKDYLTKKGIDARRIKAVGYGKTKPLASNDDEEEGREINRRVEFKILQN
jgi:outer membrane protein OmpA-like peptidoglycan-associated protein/tetratricopeptide (TPR) repeat protein